VPNPIVAIVGRPNVGKSTLFNRLIGERRAVTHELPGTTRDRLYGTTDWNGREFSLVDTGGLGLDLAPTDDGLLAEVVGQAQEAIQEADVIVFLLDAQSGPTAADVEVAELLRRANKPLITAANKVENRRTELASSEFYELGLGDPLPLSAIQGQGTGDLLDAVVESLPPSADLHEEAEAAVSIAIVGRPNVGKSSLLNAITGQRRSIVNPRPGTTRDPIDSLVRHDGRAIRLIDTAGIRRRGRVERGVETFSVLRAIRSIERADVVALLVDAVEGITAQDSHVAGYAHDAAKGLIVVANKWDLVEKDSYTTDAYIGRFQEALSFVPYAPVVFISALTGLRVHKLLDLALDIQTQRHKRVPTAALNNVVREAVAAHRVTVHGRPLRIYYATQPETSPPTFVLFANDPALVHFSYRRYLENRLRDAFGFNGTAIRLIFRGHNENSPQRSQRN
jgi:GTP-binding protein